MDARRIVTSGYFDGERLHVDGPYSIDIALGVIRDIQRGDRALDGSPLGGSATRVGFVLPGLVEGHAHLFLDGAELDVNVRKDYLKAPLEQMLDVGRRSLADSLAAGVTMVRDAGDIYGVNGRLKAELKGRTGASPELRSPGRAIRKAKRYGSFMAEEVTDHASIVKMIEVLAPTADDLKILLTGIIDFEKGEMKGGVQFDAAETNLIVTTARQHGLRTYAHCSGMEGLRIAVDAGIDSIEHGFFLEKEILREMADKSIAWVPTFSPVYFQWERPELAGWNPETVGRLWGILERHFENIAFASDIGVPIVAGSDAGSYGVPHGKALVDELLFLRRAGMSMDKVLASATSVPRRLWGCPPANIAVGQRANLVALDASPIEDPTALRGVRLVYRNGWKQFAQPAVV